MMPKQEPRGAERGASTREGGGAWGEAPPSAGRALGAWPPRWGRGLRSSGAWKLQKNPQGDSFLREWPTGHENAVLNAR